VLGGRVPEVLADDLGVLPHGVGYGRAWFVGAREVGQGVHRLERTRDTRAQGIATGRLRASTAALAATLEPVANDARGAVGGWATRSAPCLPSRSQRPIPSLSIDDLMISFVRGRSPLEALKNRPHCGA
jgi:hypothetical protein